MVIMQISSRIFTSFERGWRICFTDKISHMKIPASWYTQCAYFHDRNIKLLDHSSLLLLILHNILLVLLHILLGTISF